MFRRSESCDAHGAWQASLIAVRASLGEGATHKATPESTKMPEAALWIVNIVSYFTPCVQYAWDILFRAAIQ